jgi:hypothetical protein
MVSSALVAASAALLPFLPIPIPQFNVIPIPLATDLIIISASSFFILLDITMKLSPPRKNVIAPFLRNASDNLA